MAYDLHSYDRYICCFSGGKDSSSLVLYLLENGISRDKIELWHQDIDGCGPTFMDWEITPDYCRRFAQAFGVQIYFQWKEGGFYREMMRRDTPTAPIRYELTDGTVGCSGGTRGKPGTRLRFPQAAADLRTRWCSSYLKIDVCSTAIVHQPRFQGIRTLVLSGERGEESPQRAKYAIWEPDRADLRNGRIPRHVDRHRPLREWKEEQVWALLEKYRVRAHPCYYMGWPRCSCRFCIFSTPDQFASAAQVCPAHAREICGYEESFGCTIRRDRSLRSCIASGKPYAQITPQYIRLANSRVYDQSIILPPDEPWILPAGAFGESCGVNT